MEKFEHFPGVLCTKVGLAKELKGKQMARTKPSQCSLQSAGSLAKNRLVPVQHSPTPSLPAGYRLTSSQVVFMLVWPTSFLEPWDMAIVLWKFKHETWTVMVSQGPCYTWKEVTQHCAVPQGKAGTTCEPLMLTC